MIHLASFYRDHTPRRVNGQAASAAVGFILQCRGYGAEVSVRWCTIQYPSQYVWMEVDGQPMGFLFSITSRTPFPHWRHTPLLSSLFNIYLKCL
jgi:hypothetical protein